MVRQKTMGLTVFSLVLASGAACFGRGDVAAEPGPHAKVEALRGTKSDRTGERFDAAEAIRAERAALVKALIALAGEKVHDPEAAVWYGFDGKTLAIYLLGEMRAEEAVPVLLENIDYKHAWEEGGLPTRARWYPAVSALMQIGLPAVDPIIRKLVYGAARDTTARRNCLYTLRCILGNDLGRVKLELELKDRKNRLAAGRGRANLKAALEYFANPVRESLDLQTDPPRDENDSRGVR